MLRFVKSIKNGSIFQRFLKSYLIILIITLTIGVAINSSVTKALERSVLQANLTMLKQVRDMLDSRMREINKFAVQLSWNNKVQSMLNIRPPLKNSDYYRLYDMKRTVTSTHLLDTFITTFYIHLKKPDLIVSPEAVYTNMRFFYGYFFRYDNIEYEVWYKQILNRYNNGAMLPSAPITIKGEERSGLVYVQSIPIESINQFNGTVMILIDEDEITKILNGFNVGDGCIYIVDKDGQILTQVSHNDETVCPVNLNLKTDSFADYDINGEKTTVFRTTSKYNGWTYVAVLPKNVVLQQVAYINKITWAITLGALLIGLLSAFVFAYKNSKPMQELSTKLRRFIEANQCDDCNEYDVLEVGVSNILRDNEALQSNIQEMLPLIRSAFFDHLFKGQYVNTKEIETACEFNGINLDGNGFFVLILKLNGFNGLITKGILEELYKERFILKNTIQNIIKDYSYTHDIDNDKVAALIKLQCEDRKYKDEAKSMVNQILEGIKCVCGLKIDVGVGGIYNSLLDVSRSYDEAYKALEYKTSNNNIVWYNEVIKESKSYYYPVEVELKLMNIVKSGGVDEMNKLLKDVYCENFTRRQLSVDMSKHFINEIYNTVIKLMEQIPLDDDTLKEVRYMMDNFENLGSVNEASAVLIDIYTRICTFINKQKKSRNVLQKDKIISYLNSNYMDANLSLSSVASKFELTDVYLSQFFQEQTGEKFSNYLEGIRLQHAVELLHKTDQSIKSIAQAVGYNSANSFYRAYKRVYGVSPTLSRHSIEKETSFS